MKKKDMDLTPLIQKIKITQFTRTQKINNTNQGEH